MLDALFFLLLALIVVEPTLPKINIDSKDLFVAIAAHCVFDFFVYFLIDCFSILLLYKHDDRTTRTTIL
jgi:hypothetical protein